MEELPVLIEQVQDKDVKDQRLEKLAMRPKVFRMGKSTSKADWR
jgi:hypothetical protein